MTTGDNIETKSVRVTSTVAQPLARIWDALMQPHGAEALLGEGAQLGQKGEGWRATDGTFGVTRSFHPLEQLRFSWHADEDAPATVIDLQLRAQGDGTQLALVHDHLPADADLAALEGRWSQALARVAGVAI